MDWFCRGLTPRLLMLGCPALKLVGQANWPACMPSMFTDRLGRFPALGGPPRRAGLAGGCMAELLRAAGLLLLVLAAALAAVAGVGALAGGGVGFCCVAMRTAFSSPPVPSSSLGTCS